MNNTVFAGLAIQPRLQEFGILKNLGIRVKKRKYQIPRICNYCSQVPTSVLFHHLNRKRRAVLKGQSSQYIL